MRIFLVDFHFSLSRHANIPSIVFIKLFLHRSSLTFLTHFYSFSSILNKTVFLFCPSPGLAIRVDSSVYSLLTKIGHNITTDQFVGVTQFISKYILIVPLHKCHHIIMIKMLESTILMD